MKDKKKKKARGNKKVDLGFVESPLIKGLLQLIPLVVLFVVGGLVLIPVDNELQQLKLAVGSQPDSVVSHKLLAAGVAKKGDYKLAEREYVIGSSFNNNGDVLGASSEIEDAIWPERRILDMITAIENGSAPESRFNYLRLAKLYWEVNDIDTAREYLSRAIAIDPNDVEIGVFEILLNN